MQRAIISIISILLCQFAIAQDGRFASRFNINASYSVGLQFFNFNGLEEFNNYLLTYKMPNANGFFRYEKFVPTVLQRVEISASIFRNKTWYVGISRGWGKNEIISYGYIADANNNTITEYKSKTSVSAAFTGYFIKKHIRLAQWGTLQPFIGFYPFFSVKHETIVTNQVKDNTTGELLKSTNVGGGNGAYLGGNNSGILTLFNNPKVGVNYSVKLHSHVIFEVGCSYWWANSIINDFYGSSNHYFIPFKGSKAVIPARSRYNYKDLYGFSLSVGLRLQLRK